LNDLYDIKVTGDTTDLSINMAQVDPLLTGDGDLDIAFVRDTTGTRLERLNIATQAAVITAQADITSNGSDADFTAQIADINVVEPSLTGPVNLAGNVVQSALEVITFDIAGTGPDATISAKGTAEPLDEGFTVLANVAADIADLETYADGKHR